MGKRIQEIKERIKSKEGITLLNLVLTIIIMLILAIIVLNLMFNSGLINKAKKGASDTQSAAYNEQVTTDIASASAQDYANGNRPTISSISNTLSSPSYRIYCSK